MVGFEDSVNMVEETQDPQRIFPRTMLTGLGIAVVIYMLVADLRGRRAHPDRLRSTNRGAEGRALLDGRVPVGAPGFPIDKVFPFLTVFAVANTALINMLMASRLLYGWPSQDVLPRSLGRVLPGRTLAVGRHRVLHGPGPGADRLRRLPVPRVHLVTAAVGHDRAAAALVFTMVNIACLVLRRDRSHEGFFRAPGFTPCVGGGLCVSSWRARGLDSRTAIQYRIAGGLLGIGVVLWAFTWLTNRGVRAKKTGFRDIEQLDE